MYCFGSLDWIKLRDTGSGMERYNVYEEAMWWNISNKKPQFSNIKEPTDPSTYSSGESYQFNVTVTDPETEPNVTYIEFNDTSGTLTDLNNFTMSNTSTEYYKTFTNLPAGVYNYKFFANDTDNDWNSSSDYTFTISKGSSNITLFVNNTQGNTNIYNNTGVNITIVNNVTVRQST